MPFPATKAAMIEAGYKYLANKTCPCGAGMELWLTPNDKAMPMNLMPAPDSPAISHWATCPKAQQFRRNKKAMRSLFEILRLVVDGVITTKEEAAALVDEEVKEAVAAQHITAEDARKNLLASIGYASGYYSYKTADRLLELFDTEHPVFGKTHPTAEEALRMGMEYGKRSQEKKEQG